MNKLTEKIKDLPNCNRLPERTFSYSIYVYFFYLDILLLLNLLSLLIITPDF